MSVGTRRPASGGVPTDRGVRKTNDVNRGEIPLNGCLIIAWGGVATLSAPRRGDCYDPPGGSGEGQLPRPGDGGPERAPHVVPPAQHLVPDSGGGAGITGQLRRGG